jgi:hypothetical protein
LLLVKKNNMRALNPCLLSLKRLLAQCSSDNLGLLENLPHVQPDLSEPSLEQRPAPTPPQSAGIPSPIPGRYRDASSAPCDLEATLIAKIVLVHRQEGAKLGK